MSKAPFSLPQSPSFLLILMGALGDVARGLCLLEPIQNRYPGAHITWLIEPKWKSFIELHPLIDEIIVFDRPKGLRAVGKLRRKLKEKSFDITLDLQRHFKSGVFSYLSDAPIRVGFAKQNAKEGNWLFQTHYIPPYEKGSSKVDHYLSFCDLIDASYTHPLSFGLSQAELQGFTSDLYDFQEQKTLCGVVLGSSWESKDWIPTGYISLCERLMQDRDAQVLLLGDGSQQDLAEMIVEKTGASSLVGQTNVPQLTSLLARCAVVVGPDSGPGHIASAVGTPYISLFGPTDHRRVAPYATEELVVRADVACAPCLKRKCPGLDKICMRLISVDEILARFDKVVS